ncbi:uncharacterized protein LOC110429925 [Sorghum bicolor]|uniref:uncharacterized protein LOC110429925 n=1 Tax=Sorghum bicolor TaxID=4558 RepID=UPI000B4268F6|nr:uncharacterized protein LOC110429925 [Sorghum bicolor]|eukprot:XP_021302368.1 uncharacterized protein LOC110429925 [Sorghum bicolor]
MMEEQQAPARGRRTEDPRPGGDDAGAKRVEGGGDGASRSTAKREAEKAAAADEGAGKPLPLPHERVPQPRDVYNEQL